MGAEGWGTGCQLSTCEQQSWTGGSALRGQRNHLLQKVTFPTKQRFKGKSHSCAVRLQQRWGGPHPHTWLHIATPSATGKKPPGEQNRFPPPTQSVSELPGALGPVSQPWAVRAHVPMEAPWHLALVPAQRHHALGTTGGSAAACKEHLLRPNSQQRTWDAAPTADTEPMESGRVVYGNLPRAKSFSFVVFPLRLKALCSTCGGPTALCHPHSAAGCTQGSGMGFAFLCEVLFTSTITRTVTSFTRKHWRVPRSGSNLVLHGPRAGGSPLLSSSIIHVLQPLHLWHQDFQVPFHKLASPLLP